MCTFLKQSMAQVAAVETVPGTVEDVPTRLLLAFQGKDPEKRKYLWFSFLLLYIYGSVFYFYFSGTKQDIGLGCKHMYVCIAFTDVLIIEALL
jgi:hypothetical protein